MQKPGAIPTPSGERSQGGAGAVDCSVLMPVLNEEEHIIASVAAMRIQRFDGVMEFIVADGGSTDGTRAILERLAREDDRLRVVDNPGRIASSGLNVGLREARGHWVARMDAHTLYPEDYVALGVERLRRGGTRWVSGPPIATGNSPVSRAVALALRGPLGRGGSRKWASKPDAARAEYDLDSGVFAGVWARDVLLGYGGWDEQWVCNQDSEMAGRFLAAGERLVCIPAMAAEYTPRGSLPALWRQYLRYGEYRVKTAVRHPHTMRRSHLLAPSVVVSAGMACTRSGRARRLARAGLVAYGAALVVVAVQAGAEAGWDAELLPPVLATMHFAHGVGSLRGAVRHGPPLAALAATLGLKALASRLAPEPQPVFAPSLLASEDAA